MAVVVSLAQLSTGVRLAEFQAVAGLFLSDTIEKLRYGSGDEIYYHATFTQTVGRFITARDGLFPEKDDFVDPWECTGFVFDDSALDEPDDADPIADDSAEAGAETDDADAAPVPSASAEVVADEDSNDVAETGDAADESTDGGADDDTSADASAVSCAADSVAERMSSLRFRQ